MDFYGQIDTFMYTLLTGIILGIIFDFYRVLRGIWRPHIWITSVTDLVYWLVATVLVFITLIVGNWGEIRLYIFIGLLLGVAAYYRLASRTVIWLVLRGIKTINQLIHKGFWLLHRYIFQPFKYIVSILYRPVCYLIKIINNIKVKLTLHK